MIATAPYPAANLITGCWAHDVYALKTPGGAERVVRPPIERGKYFTGEYGGGRRFGHGRTSGAQAAGERRVLAPMPGRIVRVLVRAGDAVAAGQPLVVVEAMKMENELAAGRAGKVTKIHVAAGSTVESGALLVEVG